METQSNSDFKNPQTTDETYQGNSIPLALKIIYLVFTIWAATYFIKNIPGDFSVWIKQIF